MTTETTTKVGQQPTGNFDPIQKSLEEMLLCYRRMPQTDSRIRGDLRAIVRVQGIVTRFNGDLAPLPETKVTRRKESKEPQEQKGQKAK